LRPAISANTATLNGLAVLMAPSEFTMIWRAPMFEPILALGTIYGHCDDLQLDMVEGTLTAKVQYYRSAGPVADPEGRPVGTFTRIFQFHGPEAYNFYDELLMPLVGLACLDHLCEMRRSPWIARYLERRSPVDKMERHHYSIHFSKCGYLEVLCSKVTIGPETEVRS
jgi:hypothetical protein